MVSSRQNGNRRVFSTDDFLVSWYKTDGQLRYNKHSGEIEMYVNQSYQFTERADLSMNLNTDSRIEIQFIEHNYKPSNIFIQCSILLHAVVHFDCLLENFD